MSEEEYQAVNSLLAYLRSFHVVGLVEAHYKVYNNEAPPVLLQEQMNEVQKLLDKS